MFRSGCPQRKSGPANPAGLWMQTRPVRELGLAWKTKTQSCTGKGAARCSWAMLLGQQLRLRKRSARRAADQEAQKKGAPKKYLMLETQKGDVSLLLRPDSAPRTVEHVCKLVNASLYDGCYFYRSDFVLQWGLWLPSETEVENPYPDIEENETQIGTFISNAPGTVAVAHGIGVNGNSDIFINLKDNSYLDTMSLGFCVFAELADAESRRVVNELAAAVLKDEKPVITRASIISQQRPAKRLPLAIVMEKSYSTFRGEWDGVETLLKWAVADTGRRVRGLPQKALHMEMEQTHEFLAEEFYDALLPVWQEITEGRGPQVPPQYEDHGLVRSMSQLVPQRRASCVEASEGSGNQDAEKEDPIRSVSGSLHGSSMRLEALLGRTQPLQTDRSESGGLERFLCRARSGCRVELPDLLRAHDELMAENLHLRRENEVQGEIALFCVVVFTVLKNFRQALPSHIGQRCRHPLACQADLLQRRTPKSLTAQRLSRTRREALEDHCPAASTQVPVNVSVDDEEEAEIPEEGSQIRRSSWRDQAPASPSLLNAAAAAFVAATSLGRSPKAQTRPEDSRGKEPWVCAMPLASEAPPAVRKEEFKDVRPPSPQRLAVPSAKASAQVPSKALLRLPVPSAAERARSMCAEVRSRSPNSATSGSPWRKAMRPTKNAAWLKQAEKDLSNRSSVSGRMVPFEFMGASPKAWGGTEEEGFEGWVPLTIMDFTPVNRSFYVQLPKNVGTSWRPAPLLIALHSQGDQADSMAYSHDYGTFGKSLGFVTVFPQGLDDAVPGGGDLGTGWNVGTAGDDQTCVTDEVTADCYASCWEQSKCGSCNWSGCYDERLFIYSVIQLISSVLCIDESRVYVTGESNGGMLAHYLVQSLPGTFAAVVPWYGLPLLGYGLGAEFELVRDRTDCRQTAMLQLHGRQDEIMPVAGGVSGGFQPGWIYEPLNKVQQGWAAVHNCDTVASPTHTYWDGGEKNFACFDYKGCTSGRRIMRCFYDGGHGDRPGEGAADQITVWFLLQYRLDAGHAGVAYTRHLALANDDEVRQSTAFHTFVQRAERPPGSTPSTDSIVSYVSFRISFRTEEPGRLFYSTIPRGLDVSINEMLQPIFSHINREDHAERTALLHLTRAFLKRSGWEASDDCAGWLRLYISHFLCISCVAVICQSDALALANPAPALKFVRFFPAIRLELDFDNMWKTRFEPADQRGAERFLAEGGLPGRRQRIEQGFYEW
ncbi:ppiA [Symbiodinium necroappetens]|uniref:PpiA protein n=1 Tax=Symbiodinium necroappetens TaxID=1628268 RepID=A0A812JQ35_9DINO|nr:ppiA [Symbiodinium necroappetens]